MNKFKIGDKVRVFGSSRANRLTDCGIITKPCSIGEKLWYVHSNKWKDSNILSDDYVFESDMELILKTIKDVEVGDEIICLPSRRKFTIEAISGNLIAVCPLENKSISIGMPNNNITWCRKWVIEKEYKLLNQSSETITIEGKVYNKEEVEKRLSELKPIE